MSLLAFFEIGFGEMVMVGIVALLLFGGRLPEVMRTLGATYRSFRRGFEDLSRQALRPDLTSPPYKPIPPASTKLPAATPRPAVPAPWAAAPAAAVTPAPAAAPGPAAPAASTVGTPAPTVAPATPPAARPSRPLDDDDAFV